MGPALPTTAATGTSMPSAAASASQLPLAPAWLIAIRSMATATTRRAACRRRGLPERDIGERLETLGRGDKLRRCAGLGLADDRHRPWDGLGALQLPVVVGTAQRQRGGCPKRLGREV